MSRKSEAIQGPDVHLEPIIEHALKELERHMPHTIYLAPYHRADIFRPFEKDEIDQLVAGWLQENVQPDPPYLTHELRAMKRLHVVFNRLTDNLIHAAAVLNARDAISASARQLEAQRYITAMLNEFMPRYQDAMREVARHMKDPRGFLGLEHAWQQDFERYLVKH